ncbi:LacI family DNA-binding transcriptional regulator [Comamonas sp. BIGb0124]|uniref:LacI family DNA-binding transcriptional regulator n=1 Tax=Comamonas sp. BIGb0124 TaxID=2485130 RepID=UPI000F497EE8|nr:LacI family DNA-binding transcriptional regulator [Comamonas sp. BIGb0124]
MTQPPSPPPRARTPRSTGRVTLDDVAQAAGVSPITVSRALRGARSVAPHLVEQVRQAAVALGYVPNLAARSLASSRSQSVAVLVPLLSNQLFVNLLEAAQTVFMQAGYQTLLGVTHYRPEEEQRLLQIHTAQRPAGLLLTGFDHTPATRELIAQSGIPCVHMMELAPGEPELPCVGFSQTDAGRDITRHLLARGRRRIAFAAAQLDPRAMMRAEGYRQVMREAACYDAGLECLDAQPSSMALGGRMFERLMAERPDVDAIFFCNDDLAHGALLAAQRMGVAVPQRVAMAGFNDLEGSDLMLPPLTSVRTPRVEVGQQAAQMLLALIEGEPLEPVQVDLGFEVVVRQST